MMKLTKCTWTWLVITAVMIFILVNSSTKLVYINNCIGTWLSEDFISYTGQCTSVCYSDGIHISRYDFSSNGTQFLTGQGWHFTLDNGEVYYIPLALCGDDTPCNSTDLYELESESITIRCLPDTVIPYCNVIVSLYSGGEEYLRPDDVYAYLQTKNEDAMEGMLYVGVPAVGVFVLVAVVLIWIDVRGFRQRKKREKLKQEKINTLRTQGKLHPTKQLRKKKR